MPCSHMVAKTEHGLTSTKLCPVFLLLGAQLPVRSWTRGHSRIRDEGGAPSQGRLCFPSQESTFLTCTTLGLRLLWAECPNECGAASVLPFQSTALGLDWLRCFAVKTTTAQFPWALKAWQVRTHVGLTLNTAALGDPLEELRTPPRHH